MKCCVKDVPLLLAYREERGEEGVVNEEEEEEEAGDMCRITRRIRSWFAESMMLLVAKRTHTESLARLGCLHSKMHFRSHDSDST